MIRCFKEFERNYSNLPNLYEWLILNVGDTHWILHEGYWCIEIENKELAIIFKLKFGI
jgi:hypothetical protein